MLTLSARLWYLQCISTGDTTVLHWALHMQIQPIPHSRYSTIYEVHPVWVMLQNFIRQSSNSPSISMALSSLSRPSIANLLWPILQFLPPITKNFICRPPKKGLATWMTRWWFWVLLGLTIHEDFITDRWIEISKHIVIDFFNFNLIDTLNLVMAGHSWTNDDLHGLKLTL